MRNVKKFKSPGAASVILLLTFCFISVSFMPAASAERGTAEFETVYRDTLSYLADKTPRFGASGGEWLVFALARSGRIGEASGYFADYYKNIEETVRENGRAVLNERKPTENARLVIALSGIGRDAARVAGCNLIEPLCEIGRASKQGVNGAAYALLALDCSGSGAQTKSILADMLLEKQTAEGGWSASGSGVDTDLTAIALTALAPYEKAETAVKKGVDALSERQLENGGFDSCGNANAESVSQVIIALSALGINAAADERFIKNENSALSALLKFYTGKGFSHLSGGEANEMATEQAALALCAYDRFLKGEKTLFDTSDVKSAAQSPVPRPEPSVCKGKLFNPVPLFMIAAAAAASTAVIIIIIIAKRNAARKAKSDGESHNNAKGNV